MTIVSDNEHVCRANYIDLNAVDQSLNTKDLVPASTVCDPKIEEFGKLYETEEESGRSHETEQEDRVLEGSSPDQGSVMRSSQESLSKSDAKIVNENVQVSSKDSEVEALRESAGKGATNAGLLNGLSSFKLNQKPRSIRGINGTRKATWGSIEVLRRVSSISLEGKARRKPLNQPQASTQARKRRHHDMDMEWEAATGEKALLGKSRAQAALGSILFAQVLTGESAAITAGLQARVPSPAERIRFKDILKRRGGLQEYLECRNLIIGLWERDVRHILSMTECGISTLDETPRSALLREIYDFLNYHGYINVGIATKKLKLKSEVQVGSAKTSEGNQGCQKGGKNDRILADTDNDVSLMLGRNQMVERITRLKSNLQMYESNQQVYTNCRELQESDSGTLNGRKRGSAEEGVNTIRPFKKGTGELDAKSMDVDDKSGLQGCRDNSANSSLFEGFTEADEKANVRQNGNSPTHPDEESLLDIKNRIKARGKKKRQALQKLVMPCSEADLNGVIKDEEAKTLGECKNFLLDIEEKVAVREDSKIKVEVGKSVSDNNKVELMSVCRMEQKKVTDHAYEVADLNNITDLHDASICDSKSCNGPAEKASKAQTAFDLSSQEEKQAGQKKIIIVGAGPAGLAAARHLQRMCVDVTILEARQRVGGRVFTDRSSFSGPVDLGASIITGVEADVATERRPDPTALLCKQLDLELTTLRGDCPLFDSVTCAKVPADIDGALEAEYNSLLDDTVMLVAQHGDVAMQMSLEEGLELVFKNRRGGQIKELFSPKLTKDMSGKVIERAHINLADNCGIAAEMSESSPTTQIQSLERRVMDWHFANLEYGCAAELKRVSLPYWNQDDVYGGFAGPHCMIKGGYSTVMEALGDGLNIQLGQVVTSINYLKKDGQSKGEVGRVKVQSKNGDVFWGDAVLVTVPLGCLKADTIKFVPPLPHWKLDSIQRLGFGLLNKVVMEFPFAFWDETIDYFGATAERAEMRGLCFMFWNLKRTVGVPILTALVVGKAAIEGEQTEGIELVGHAHTILRKLFGEAAVPQAIAFAVTKWGSDPFSRGAYSYVAVGASGEDYDILGRPVENCVFFAGEATCKEHPDTVGGAMMSGLREAVRMIDILDNRGDSMAEAEAMAVAQRQSDSERNEIRDMSKRLTAAELSNAIRKDGGKLSGNEQPLCKAMLLQDMFGSAKTTAGRLLLAKEMLLLPAFSLKVFAGTREGLTILNNWILDSLGKDGTQLLRHCVRLLLVVGTDLSAIRQSGIGRTVKEKVFVHTSRDIRAVANQLVKMWVEVLRKEKAAHGVAKPLRQSVDPSHHQSASVFSMFKVKGHKVSIPNTGVTLSISKDKLSSPRCSDRDHMDASPDEMSQKLDSLYAGKTPTEGTEKYLSVEHAEHGQQIQITEQCGPISNSETAALTAAKAAEAAAEAFATAEATRCSQPELPEILSFQKFAKREHVVPAELNRRKSLEREKLVLHGKEEVTTGVDARKCKVQNWSVDFSGSCSYLGSPSMLTLPDVGTSCRDGLSLAVHNLPGISNVCTENVRVVSDCYFLQPDRQWFEQAANPSKSKESGDDTSTALSIKEAYESQGQVNSGVTSFSTGMVSMNSAPFIGNQRRDTSFLDSSSHLSPDPKQASSDFLIAAKPVRSEGFRDSLKGSDHIKKAVTDYVAQLVTPLYMTKRIQKDGYKSIVKKSTAKVMEHSSEQERAMEVSMFLDIKRKMKIRSLVDKFVERHLENVER